MSISSKVGPIKSVFLVIIFQFLASLLILGCASKPLEESKVDQPLVQPQYRLQEDRKAFDELRSQVPEDRKVENDELAYLEKLFENPFEQPGRIRDRFYKLIGKKRDLFQKDQNKRRETFVKTESADREQFSKGLERERNDFKRKKVSPDQSKSFYADLDQKRKDFYASQREKRDEFEAQMRDDRKNFEDYSREKNNDFNARLREFTQKQKDILKEQKEKQSSGRP